MWMGSYYSKQTSKEEEKTPNFIHHEFERNLGEFQLKINWLVKLSWSLWNLKWN